MSWDCPGGSVVKNLTAIAGDMGLILVWEDPTGLEQLGCVLQLLKP